MTDDGQGYGNRPVQITGEVEGAPVLLPRTRHAFTLSFSPEGDTDEYAAVGEPPFWGTIDREFAAGWMPHALAKALVDWGARSFWRRRKPRSRPARGGGVSAAGGVGMLTHCSEQFARVVYEAFGEVPYHVGSSLPGQTTATGAMSTCG